MAISLNDVDNKAGKPAARKKSKKVAKSAASKKTTKKAKKKKSTARKTRPWQSPEPAVEHMAANQADLPTAPAEALKSAAKAFQGSELEFEESVASGSTDFEKTGNESFSSEDRKKRRKELQDALVKEWLIVAEDLKNRGIESLPSPVDSLVKESWLGQIQLSPAIKIPVPDFLLTKIKP